MKSFIETLEGRTMFSVTMMDMPATPQVHPHGINVRKVHKGQTVTALYFQGTAYNTTQQLLTANLKMALTSTNTGYNVDVVVADASGRGKGEKLQLTIDATGHFTLDRDQSGGTFHLEGQLSTDLQSITGTWAEVRPTETNTGTFTLGRVKNAKTNVKKAPAPVNNLRLVGLATDTDGSASGLSMDLLQAADGTYFGVARHVNQDGSIDSINVRFDSNGLFVLDRVSGEENGSSLHVEIQLSEDKKSATGTYTSTHSNDTTTSGTITLATADQFNVKPTAPASKVTKGARYIGTATTGEQGKKSALTMDIVTTKSGAVFGLVKHTNSDGSIDTITVPFDANGHFVYDGIDKSNLDVSNLHAQGQMSEDKRTIVGSFTMSHSDNRTESGTLSFARV